MKAFQWSPRSLGKGRAGAGVNVCIRMILQITISKVPEENHAYIVGTNIDIWIVRIIPHKLRDQNYSALDFVYGT